MHILYMRLSGICDEVAYQNQLNTPHLTLSFSACKKHKKQGLSLSLSLLSFGATIETWQFKLADSVEAWK